MTTRMPWSEYAAIGAVNWSTLREIRKSPLRYQYRLRNPRPDTKATALGRAVHAACFEAFRFASDFVIWRGKVRRGKAWDAFRAEHESKGKTILTPAEFTKAEAMRDAVYEHPLVRPYLEAGEGEKTIRWVDPRTGIECKARLDWDSHSVPAVLDLKSARDIDEHWFAQQVAKLEYHGQGAFYTDGRTHASGDGIEKPYKLVVVESEPPHEVAVFPIDTDAIYAGRCDYQGMLDKVLECRATGKWPGRYTDERTLRLPQWIFAEDDESTDGLDLLVHGQTEEV